MREFGGSRGPDGWFLDTGQPASHRAAVHRPDAAARTSLGFVHLVGAGPGDGGLLTLRGAEVLRRAEVVIHDGLVSREVLRLAPPAAEVIYAGKHDRARAVPQEELNALLLASARAGWRVVRLKGGDPYVFGRGGEEAEMLAQANVPFEVVPGISSIHSVPACGGIPLTHGDRAAALTVVTGHQDPTSADCRLDWTALARIPGTLVVLMGLKHLRAIAAALVDHGRRSDTPAAVISRGASHSQQTVTGTLATIADRTAAAGLRPPAVTVMGEVVNLRSALNWYERRPLFGRRVVVTQRQDLARPTVALLRERGAQVLQVPASRILPPSDPAPLNHALARLKSFHWILFSNPEGIDRFFERFFAFHEDLRELGRARLGTYGPLTAEKLRAWHLRPVAVAADHKTPLIVEALAKCGGVRGQRVLILRGERAIEHVPEALTGLGATVEVAPCYRLEPETEDRTGDAADLVEEGADWLVFASGQAIQHFHIRFDLKKLASRFPMLRVAIASAAIQWALDQLGLEPTVIAKPNAPEDLIQGILEAEARTQCGVRVSSRWPRDNAI